MDYKKVIYDLDEFSNAFNYFWKTYKDYQKAQDDADIIKETAKDFLASVMSELGQDRSEVKLERLARGSEKWKEFRKGQFTAMRIAGEKKVKYFSALRYFDTIQSGLAYKRAELQKLGG